MEDFASYYKEILNSCYVKGIVIFKLQLLLFFEIFIVRDEIMQIRNITRDEIVQMLSSGKKIRFVDVRGKQYYDEEHIAGAILLPLLELREKAPTALPQKDEIIITYCVDINCPKSEKAAKILTSLGYKNVFSYQEGIKDYVESGLPLEGSLYRKS